MPDYDALIAQLEAGLGSEFVTIEEGGRRLTYRGTSDIMAAIQRLEDRKARALRGRGALGTTVVSFSSE